MLASLAKKENWNFSRSEFKRPGQNYPIFAGYLNYTFLRLQQQEKNSHSDDGNRGCFNTGLQTVNEKDIYASFYRNKHAVDRDLSDWTLFGNFGSYSNRLTDYRPLPAMATYIDDSSDLVFDAKCEIEVNYDHLSRDNVDRLPDVLQKTGN